MPPFVSSPRLNSVQRASGRRMRTMLLTGACITALVVGQARAGGVSGGNVVYGNASINYGANNTHDLAVDAEGADQLEQLLDRVRIERAASCSPIPPPSRSTACWARSPSVIDGSLFATGKSG